MEPTPVRQLTFMDSNAVLHLRLLNIWHAGNPVRSGGFSEFSTLWTDDSGTLIQGVAANNLTDHFTGLLRVSAVYSITGFSQRPGKRMYRPCSIDRLLTFDRGTVFADRTQDFPQFIPDSYEFQQMESLTAAVVTPGKLIDVVGRVTSLTNVAYLLIADSPKKRQAVVFQDECGNQLSITLWDSFAELLDPRELLRMDATNPVIVAFGCLALNTFRGKVNASSSSATRITIDPPISKTPELAAAFRGQVGIMQSVTVACDTAQKATTARIKSTKTIAEIMSIRFVEHQEGKYTCIGRVTDIDSNAELTYKGCGTCSRTAQESSHGYWCDEHRVIQEHQTKRCFRVRFMVQDRSGYAPFLLLGDTAADAFQITATTVYGTSHIWGSLLPPEIEYFRGKEFTFVVYLKAGPGESSSADLCVSQLQGDNLPKARRNSGPAFGPLFPKQTPAWLPSTQPPLPHSHYSPSPADGPSSSHLGSPLKRPRVPIEMQQHAHEVIHFSPPVVPPPIDMSRYYGDSSPVSHFSGFAPYSPSTPGAPYAALPVPLQNPQPSMMSSHQSPVVFGSPSLSAPATFEVVTPTQLHSPLEKLGLHTPTTGFDAAAPIFIPQTQVDHIQPPFQPSPSPASAAAGVAATGLDLNPQKQPAIPVVSPPTFAPVLAPATSVAPVPPSMRRVNPASIPSARIKLEKLESNTTAKKKDVVDLDNELLSELISKKPRAGGSSSKKGAKKELFPPNA